MGNWMIRRVETILGTAVEFKGQWFGNFGSEEEARKVAKQMAEREALDTIAIKFEIAYMK
jgi:hypothetical protein